MSFSKLQEMVKDWEAWHAAVYGVTNSRTWLSDWATTMIPWAGRYPRQAGDLKRLSNLPPREKGTQARVPRHKDSNSTSITEAFSIIFLNTKCNPANIPCFFSFLPQKSSCSFYSWQTIKLCQKLKSRKWFRELKYNLNYFKSTHWSRWHEGYGHRQKKNLASGKKNSLFVGH